MATRTRLPKPTRKAVTVSARLTRVLLREDLARGFRPLKAGESRVNRAAGIIRGVKVLGLISQNGRRYTLEAVHKAQPLYEGVKVYPDHPAKATKTRSVTEPFGWLENVQPASDGLYADLHVVNPAEPSQFIKDLYWLAENKADFFALSHNADGEGATDARGVFVVQRITEVRSVDLVTDGATNRSLFESQTMQTTLRQLIESDASRKALFGRHLLEIGDDLADLPMDMPAEPVADEGDWKADLVAAIGKLVSSADEADHKTAMKIMAMLKPGSAAPAEDVTTEAEDEEEKDKKDKDKPVKESRPSAHGAGVTLTEAKAKQFCRLAGLDPDKEKTLLEAMAGSNEETALKLLEWAKGKINPRTNGVRSQGAIGHQAPGTGTNGPAKSLEEFKKRILR